MPARRQNDDKQNYPLLEYRVNELEQCVDEIKRDVLAMKIRAAAWGFLGGLVTSLLALLAVILQWKSSTH